MALNIIRVFSFFSTVWVIHSIPYYLYTVYVSEYPTRGGIETMREYLETRSDKSILSNSLCDLVRIILKKNRQLKYHQKRSFVIGTKFAPPYSNLFMTGFSNPVINKLEYGGEFSKTVSLNLSCGYDTLIRFLVYEPKVPNN